MTQSNRAPIALDIVSDVVCPWCYVGKRRFERAMRMVAIPLAVRWRPFQLDPTIPPGGIARRDYLMRKFGSDERIRQLQANIVEVGEAEGIRFVFDRIAVSPNTLDAHRLIRWAAAVGAQEEIVEALFRAYFIEGRDIGDRAGLADIAAGVGMEGSLVAARLATEEDREEVTAEIAAAQRIGISGVPTFIFDNRYSFVGAQPAEQIVKALQVVASRQDGDRISVGGS
jgi:predicted DsbA family dithiol-disulfide isomerase